MSIEGKIKKDFIISLKDKNEEKTQVLRMVLSVVKNKEIEKKLKLKDDEVLDVLSSEVKKRKEAALLYKKGSRDELAEKEEREIIILSGYMPKSFSEKEIEIFVKDAIKECHASGKKDMGKVMSFVMLKLKGRADGNIVSKVVNKILSENEE